MPEQTTLKPHGRLCWMGRVILSRERSRSNQRVKWSRLCDSGSGGRQSLRLSRIFVHRGELVTSAILHLLVVHLPKVGRGVGEVGNIIVHTCCMDAVSAGERSLCPDQSFDSIDIGVGRWECRERRPCCRHCSCDSIDPDRWESGGRSRCCRHKSCSSTEVGQRKRSGKSCCNRHRSCDSVGVDVGVGRWDYCHERWLDLVMLVLRSGLGLMQLTLSRPGGDWCPWWLHSRT